LAVLVFRLAILALLAWPVAGLPVRSAVAAASGDLLSAIPVVNENALNNAACGVAAATMVLDYYLPQSGSIHKALDIKAVSQFVKEYPTFGPPKGTTTDQLKDGIEQASNEPTMEIGTPLTATWNKTDQAGWFAALQGELDQKHPVIVYLADGHTVWPKQAWHYGHYIVVSGYTADQGIIYHDPWDGQMHTLSNGVFGAAWGTTWGITPVVVSRNAARAHNVQPYRNEYTANNCNARSRENEHTGAHYSTFVVDLAQSAAARQSTYWRELPDRALLRGSRRWWFHSNQPRRWRHLGQSEQPALRHQLRPARRELPECELLRGGGRRQW
jgi:hypothetical protein